MVAQKGGRVPGIREGGAKKFVVRLVQGIVRHEDARQAEETAATPRGVVSEGGFGRSERQPRATGG